jgi:ABC-type ATPase with predicted acetyltransferase domain
MATQILPARADGGSTGRRGRVRLTDRGRTVAGLFSLDPTERWAPATPVVDVPVEPGAVVLITGPSGAGKTTLLRQTEAAMRARGMATLALEAIPVDRRRALIDTFPEPLERALQALSRAGLSEARLLLRPPARLSIGEVFRYRLARFMAGTVPVLVADEFTATLDRVTARVVAWQVGRFVRDSVRGAVPRAAVLATSHEDVEEDLQPTVVVRLSAAGVSVDRKRE